MGKFTKLMLTFALLIAGVGGVNAGNATLDQLEAAYGATSDWKNSLPASYPVNVLDATIFGSDAGTQTTNANVNNYDYIYFVVTDFVSARAVRVFFWDPNQNARIDYFLKPVADKETANYGQETTVSAAGTYCVKIPDGARLQGAKTPWTSSAASDPYFKFSSIYLTERETPYVELVPYTLVWTPNAGTYRATIPLSESHIRTTGNVSINYSTGEVTNTGSGKLIIYLNNEDLVGASLYHADVTNNLEPTLEVADAVNGEVGGIYGSRYNWNIAGDGSRNTKIGSVTALRYNFSNTGSMTFTSIYFDANQLIAGTTNKNLADMPYGRWGAPANVISQYIDVDSYKTNNIGGGAHDMIYGHDGIGDAHKYVDLTNCSKMTLTGLSSNGRIRLFYNWDGTEGGKPTETLDNFPKDASGTYVFDIDAFKKSKGISFFHLNGIKTEYNQNATISAITVDEYSNVISGSGIDRTKNYLLNPYITSIDATGVTAATEIAPANPNCLITANAGKVTNDKNVIVGGVCANLELVDGKPFKAPAAFTATAAPTYDRAFTASTTTTVCLPFALTAAEATTLGTFYELSNFDGSTLHFTSVDAPVANKPYLVVPTATGLTLSETEKSIVATPANLGTTVTNVDFIGTLAATAIPASATGTGESDYSYYAYNNGSLVKVTSKAATLPAFRGYFKVKNSGINAAARSLNISFDNEATGISDALMNSDERTVKSEVYNLNGQRVAAPQKGLYIVNGKKVIVK